LQVVGNGEHGADAKSIAPISVIIPCYQCTDTLFRALNSALHQTLQPSEIILIDDASGDGTLEMLLQYEKEHFSLIKVIAQNKNGGPGMARNAGWEVASQPWLAFLDADDEWHPRKLEIQWSWLSAHPEVSLCGHGTRLSDGQHEHVDEAAVASTTLTTLQMLFSNRLPTRSVMLRRDLPFRFMGKDVTEDYLLWLQIILAGFSAQRMELCLAYSLRPDFSPGGYSGQLWRHEKRELAAMRVLRSDGKLSWPIWFLAASWSCIKYLRRRFLRRQLK